MKQAITIKSRAEFKTAIDHIIAYGEQIAVTRQGSRDFPPVFYQANFKGKRFTGKSLRDLAKQFNNLKRED